MADKPLQVVGGYTTEVEATVASAGAANAGDLVALDANGLLDPSVMPVGIGADTLSAPASENLTAGDYVNVWNDSGTVKVRKADASTASAAKRATGFVLSNVTAPANALVYFEGKNTALSGLTPGATYVLSHTVPGGVTILASGTTTAGHILQELGDAVSTTILSTEIQRPIVRG
jgi:hypothetical protein